MKESAHKDPPFIVGQANELRRAFQSGDDDAMLAIIALGAPGGLQDRLIEALLKMDDRQATYAAPYMADLAKRLGWLQK